MKKLTLIAICALFALTASAQTQVTLLIKVNYDMNKMGGLTTNDYSTNFVLLVSKSLTASNPTNVPSSYVPFTNYPGNFFIASQGVGTWTDRVTVASSVGFWVLQITNITDGGVGPFSQPYPMLLDPVSGQVGVSR